MRMADTITTAELDIGMVVQLPEWHHRSDDVGTWVEIIDYTRPDEYGSGVYAYADASTGEYMGLLRTNPQFDRELPRRS